ncbi:hypothetical protein V496_09010 [Pseudogymnoascus sp. VKM F-4515 (FW-2607)]|nr:hypothetical protein V496_09010 [Pseudogymnoascus sp. VKM F-4515 (FW-2607)]KFY93911.1 hypothetical protein V498_04173 [Pseudogymnoascus sp. VKM F-4517 (FW-2822)]
MGSKDGVIDERGSAEFRKYIPDLNTPRFQTAKVQDCYQYAETFQESHNPPWLYNLTQAWQELLREPYKGLTTDGNVIPNLFQPQDEGVPIESIVTAINKVLDQISSEQKEKVSFPLNSKEWRAWSNPEILLRPLGLRLEELDAGVAASVLDVLKATFSTEGYDKALAAMRINQYLGQICEVPKIMNELSYNFLVFGTPSKDKPWGWSLYGHHLCLNVFLHGRQIVISPTFTGAEPNMIDTGPFAGTEILHDEGNLGLELMQSLPGPSQDKAQIFKLLRDPAMLQSGDLAKDRWNPDDQRHVCGAFRDNRIVPLEGVSVASFTAKQKQLILDIAYHFVLYLPDAARKIRLKQVADHLDETYFCWIGRWGNDDAFYYRIQSSVIIMEFDHHSGVFLSNTEPEKFHVHTILRTPNAGDYGAVLRSKEDMVE